MMISRLIMMLQKKEVATDQQVGINLRKDGVLKIIICIGHKIFLSWVRPELVKKIEGIASKVGLSNP